MREMHHDGQGRGVHPNVHHDANESNEHGPICGAMEAEEGDEHDEEEENGFSSDYEQHCSLIK